MKNASQACPLCGWAVSTHLSLDRTRVEHERCGACEIDAATQQRMSVMPDDARRHREQSAQFRRGAYEITLSAFQN